MSSPNHAIPSLADGSLASRIQGNPSASIDGGHSIPTFQQLAQHLMGLKYKVYELSQNVVGCYNELSAAGFAEGEPAILVNRFLKDSETLASKLNEISLRTDPNYMGPARNAQESESIVFNSTEATELFTQAMLDSSLSIQRLQEILIQVQLAQNAQAASAQAEPTQPSVH